MDDVNGNQARNLRNNSAAFSRGTNNITTSAPNVRVLESQLDIQKDAYIRCRPGCALAWLATTVSYAIVMRHPTPTMAYDTDAFDTTFSDPSAQSQQVVIL